MAWPTIRMRTVFGKGGPAKYEVVDDLGAGAFGRVYKVKTEATGAFYAFKTLRDSLQHRHDWLAHFENEAKKWVRLPVHANLVQAHEYLRFRDQRDRPFIKMEFVDGATLKHIMGEERYLAPCQVVEYAIGVCEGLKKACDVQEPGKLLMHRDISPDNILISGAENVPKVTDFGLAKYETEQTLGTTAGKWPFMAPDVIKYGGWRGVPTGRLDRRADIYSLGATLYLALSGKHPIPLRSGEEEMAEAILHEPPGDLASCLPADSAGTPAALLELVMSCLSKDPAQRPQTYDVLIESLMDLQDDVEAASDVRHCASCGFRSRRGSGSRECPVCRGSSFDEGPRPVRRRRRPAARRPATVEEEAPAPEATFLRIPEGKSVVGANVTFLMDLGPTAAAQGVSLESLGKPTARSVELGTFEVGQTPVTEQEYARFEAETGYKRGQRFPAAGSEVPVVGVTFADAEAFCEWAGGRLTTADEWEKAARGTDGRAYPWGNEFRAALCACRESEASGRMPVGPRQEARSPFGLLDCVGNVGEFVDAGRGTKKLVRGGCFEDLCQYYGLLWARMWFVEPSVSDPTIGFRMAKDVNGRQPSFEARFVPVEGRAAVGCDESLIPELECRMPLSDSVLEAFRDSKLRIISLEPFEIGVFPVTNEEYWQFVQATGHGAPEHWRKEPFPWTGRSFLAKYAHHPVVHVTHADALAYCRWLSDKDGRRTYRLPTREQWEAAARGPEPRVYPWGETFAEANCNGGESLWARTVEVREYPEGDSPSGCRQMIGNVFEWLLDESGHSRFMRGGSFASACEVFGMTFFQMETDRSYESEQTGFRIVRE